MTPTPTVIHFTCHACGMALTVPLELAGVSGPCPRCQAMITSPKPEPAFGLALPPMPAPAPASVPELLQSPPTSPPLGPSLLPVTPSQHAPAWQALQLPSAPPSSPPAAGPLPPLGPAPVPPVPVPRSPAPSPSVVVRDLAAWQTPAGKPLEGAPPWPGLLAATGENRAEAGTPLLSHDGRPPGTHPVLNHVLQATPPAGQGLGHIGAIGGPSILPGLPQQRPNAMATGAASRHHALTPNHRQSAGRSRQVVHAGSGRRGAMIGSLLMATLVLAGIGWFFRDPLRVAYMTYTLQNETDEASAPPLDSPASTVPTKPEVSAKTETTIGKPGEPPKVAPPPAPLVPRQTPTPPTLAESAKPTAAPNPLTKTEPPVTVLPPLPVTPEDKKAAAGLSEIPEAPMPTQQAALSPRAMPPLRILESATPETQLAVEALKRFFAAADWKSRAEFVQTPDKIRPLMELYYQQNHDGPLDVRQIQLIRHDKAPNTGGPPHCVFQVSGGDLKQPLPVMVEEDGGRWQVDWLTFTEFKDELLLKFLDSFQDEPRRFHVMMRRTHYFDADVPDIDKLTCFEIQPPMPGFSGYVFVRRGTPLIQELDRNVGWEVSKAAALVELQWHKQGNHQWVELTAVPQYNWRNPAAVRAPSKAELVE